jgi:hypothetical protein
MKAPQPDTHIGGTKLQSAQRKLGLAGQNLISCRIFATACLHRWNFTLADCMRSGRSANFIHDSDSGFR